MSAFVLVADKSSHTPEAVEAYAYGNREAVLPLRVTYFGSPVAVWQFPTMLNAQWQADRLSSGMYAAVAFDTLAEVQERAREWGNA